MLCGERSQNERGDILRNRLGEKKQFGGKKRKGEKNKGEEKKKINSWERKEKGKRKEEIKERVGCALFDFLCFDSRKSID